MTVNQQRQHYWDLIRGLLLLGGIPYHAALIYHPDRDWRIVSPEKEPIFAALSDMLTSFRMPVFFIVAGYFSLMILQRQGGKTWFKGRLTRLGVPLVAAAILLNPVQMWFIAQANSPEPIRDFYNKLSSVGVHWIRHLWFLQALIIYSAILVLMRSLFNDPGSRIRAAGARFATLAGGLQLAVLALIAGIYLIIVSGTFSVAYSHGYQPPLNEFFDPQRCSNYAVFFFIGALAMRSPAILKSLTSFTILAPIGIALVLTAPLGLFGDSNVLKLAQALTSGFTGVGMANALLWAASRFFDRPNKVVTRLVDASFTIYLVHQPIIIVLGTLLLGYAYPPLLEVLFICVTCLALSYLFHKLITLSPAMLFAFNGVRRKAAGS